MNACYNMVIYDHDWHSRIGIYRSTRRITNWQAAILEKPQRIEILVNRVSEYIFREDRPYVYIHYIECPLAVK